MHVEDDVASQLTTLQASKPMMNINSEILLLREGALQGGDAAGLASEWGHCGDSQIGAQDGGHRCGGAHMWAKTHGRGVNMGHRGYGNPFCASTLRKIMKFVAS